MESLTTTIKSSPDWTTALAGIDYSTQSLATAYNIINNIKDKDYQKALQQQIFQREDTAVQRRMNDLQSAGLNPNLAAGSAAGAGAVVGRSVTPAVNPGSALDTLAAIQQIRNQKMEGNILRNQNRAEYMKANMLELDAYEYDNIVNFQKYLNGRDYESTPYIEYMKAQLDGQKNAAEIIEKENKWFTADKVEQYARDVISGVSGFTPKQIRRIK